jgi:hypothetical protein
VGGVVLARCIQLRLCVLIPSSFSPHVDIHTRTRTYMHTRTRSHAPRICPSLLRWRPMERSSAALSATLAAARPPLSTVRGLDDLRGRWAPPLPACVYVFAQGRGEGGLQQSAQQPQHGARSQRKVSWGGRRRSAEPLAAADGTWAST